MKETLTENIDVANKEQLKKQNNDALYIKSLFADVLLSYIWLIISVVLVITYIITLQ